MANSMPLIHGPGVLPGVIRREKCAVRRRLPIIISILEVSPGCSMRLLEKIGICLLVIMLSACSAAPFSQPVVVHKTPAPVLAGGEPVLAHSQIHFHDAPLPGKGDLQFGNGDWTLAGEDNVSARAVMLPACCASQVPAPLWFHALAVPLLSAPVIAQKNIYLLASDGFLHLLNA